MNHLTAVRTVAIPVTDQDRALDFYVTTLGFTKVADAELPQLNGRWIVVALPGTGTTLALVPATPDQPTGTDTGIRFGTEDAAAAHQHLTSTAVDLGELLAWPGVPPMFTFRDPDGNQFYVVQD